MRKSDHLSPLESTRCETFEEWANKMGRSFLWRSICAVSCVVISMSNEESFSSASQDGTKANSVVVKIALIGDAAIGKTSLMVKYVEDKYDEDYIQTLGTPMHFDRPGYSLSFTQT